MTGAAAGTAYWEARYRDGGCSGKGSRGAEALAKVATVQGVINRFGVTSMLDLGCGDGFVAKRLDVARYVGYDPAPTAVAACRALMPDRTFTTTLPDDVVYRPEFDLTMSLDVLFHLVDGSEYDHHLAALLGMTTGRALVYATNHDERGAAHVLHRRWVEDVPPGWDLEDVELPFAPDKRKRATLIRWGNPTRAEEVQGLIPARVGALLERAAADVKPGQCIVEIGAYTGRSTAFLARGARDGVRVLSVDPHGLPGAERGRLGRFAGDHIRGTYLRNLHDSGAIARVTPIRSLSADAPLPEEPIGLLWIDGDHSLAAVLGDVRRWAPHVAPGGRIVIDDHGTWHPGVNETVRRMQQDARWVEWDFGTRPLACARRAAT